MWIKKTSLAWVYSFFAVCWLVLWNIVHNVNKKLKDEETYWLVRGKLFFKWYFRQKLPKEKSLAAIIEELPNIIVVNQKKHSSYYSSHLPLWKNSKKLLPWISTPPPLFDVRYFISASLEWAPFFSQKGAHLKNST